ncbi:MAG: transcription elongation factor GreA [Anaerolineales bacterium]|nr:transcription elongation factor GreA [Anaerolineales bacterium]
MPTTFLTKEGYQKLADELDYLRTTKRKEVAERLHEAMEGGELIENAEYEAAKNEQAFVEGRIQEVEMILASARIIEEQANDPSTIEVGDTAVVKEGEGSSEEYTIVGAAEANPREGKISNESPLGRALLNHRVGDEVTVEAPGGTFKVRVVKIK